MMVELDQVQAARERLAPHVHRTPVFTCRGLDEAAGQHVVLKAENLQRGGSFKVRGATNTLLTLDAAARARGVVAYSSGNHAQGVALAARAAGTRATVVMPRDAPASKREAATAYGAEVVPYDPGRESREEVAAELARNTGRPLVPPFDDPRIVAGQGTVLLELLEQAEELDGLLVPVGGGGLLAGCCVVARARWPGLRIFGVEPRLAAGAHRSLAAGRPMPTEAGSTLCDGLRPPQVGEVTFAHFHRTVEEVLLVDEEEVARAVRFLLTRAKLLVEPSGAVGVAALLAGRLPLPRGARVGVILSGGNVDPAVLASLLATR
jgi:threonine dehydratase